MQIDEMSTERPSASPKVVIAMVLLWLLAALSVFATFFAWQDYGARIEHNQNPDSAMLTAFSAMIVMAMALPSATGFQLRKNWARVVGMVLSALGCVGALFSLAVGPAGLIALALYGVLYAMLISATAKEWCGRPRRRGAWD